MPVELKITHPTAKKKHKCMYCGGTINVGEKYERQTNLYDGQIYDWVAHLECQEVTGLLNMFDHDYGEGVDGETFTECLQEWLYDKHYNNETDTYDEGFDPDELSYHEIVLNVIKEFKVKTPCNQDQ